MRALRALLEDLSVIPRTHMHGLQQPAFLDPSDLCSLLASLALYLQTHTPHKFKKETIALNSIPYYGQVSYTLPNAVFSFVK